MGLRQLLPHDCVICDNPCNCNKTRETCENCSICNAEIEAEQDYEADLFDQSLEYEVHYRPEDE